MATAGEAAAGEEEQIKAWVDDGLHGGEDRYLVAPPWGRGRRSARWPRFCRGALWRGTRARPRCGWTIRRRGGSARSISAGWAWCLTATGKKGVLGVDLHRLLQPAPVRVAHLLPGGRGGWSRFRGGLELFRRGLPGGDPRFDESDRRERPTTSPPVQRHVHGVRPVTRLRRGPGSVRNPTDKPRVERVVPYVRENFFRGEEFIVALSMYGGGPRQWCSETAGDADPWHHPVPPGRGVPWPRSSRFCCRCRGVPFDVPEWADPKVHRDFHVKWDGPSTVSRTNWSATGARPGRPAKTVKFYFRGELVKLHPRKPPGGRSTDPEEMPSGKEVYATRDLERLR